MSEDGYYSVSLSRDCFSLQPRLLRNLTLSLGFLFLFLFFSYFGPKIWFSSSSVTAASKEGRYRWMSCADIVVLGVWGQLEQTVRRELQAVWGGELGAVTHWAEGRAPCHRAAGAVVGQRQAFFPSPSCFLSATCLSSFSPLFSVGFLQPK